MTDQLSASEALRRSAIRSGTLSALLAGFVPEGPLPTLILVIEGLCVALDLWLTAMGRSRAEAIAKI